MSTVERTPQQFDPAGSVGSRIFTTVLMVVNLGYAIVVTWLSSTQVRSVALAIAALLVLAGSAAVVVVQSRPERAPVRRSTLVIAVGLALGAMALSAAASWMSNLAIRDDWGPIGVGLVLLAFGSYRPARELAISGVISALVIGVVVFVQVPFLATSAPPLAFAIVALTPPLAFCFAGVAHSISSVAAIERWMRTSVDDNRIVEQRLEVGIARAVQHDRVTILSRDLLPFFGEVLERGELTAADRRRAVRIAESIRAVMVAEVDRSWLESLVDLIAPTSLIDDEERLAMFISTEGRTALRALIVAIAETDEFDSSSLTIELFSETTIEPGTESCSGVLTARLAPEITPRVDYAPYFAVLRATFQAFDVETHHSDLIVRFSYDHR